MKLQVSNTNQPTWHNLVVSNSLPKKLRPLEELSKNLWWVWNSEGKIFSVTLITISGAAQAKTP